jgi:hypothetical protein
MRPTYKGIEPRTYFGFQEPPALKGPIKRAGGPTLLFQNTAALFAGPAEKYYM